MKTTLKFCVLALSMSFWACEPDQEQRNILSKQHNDSIKQDSIKRFQQRAVLEKEKADSIDLLKSEFIEMKARLEVENDKMNRLKQYFTGRTELVRERQIRNESRYVQQVNDSLSILETRIASLRTKDTTKTH